MEEYILCTTPSGLSSYTAGKDGRKQEKDGGERNDYGGIYPVHHAIWTEQLYCGKRRKETGEGWGERNDYGGIYPVQHAIWTEQFYCEGSGCKQDI